MMPHLGNQNWAWKDLVSQGTKWLGMGNVLLESLAAR